MAGENIPLQALFDQDAGMALAKQLAFADTLPCKYDECMIQEDEGTGLIDIPGFDDLFPVQLLGIEDRKAGTWTHAWGTDLLPPNVFAGASQEFCLQFRGHRLFENAQSSLKECNGDFFSVIATDIMDASTYIALPLDDTKVAYWLIFDMPLDNLEPLPPVRYDAIWNYLVDSEQVEDYFGAMRFLLFNNGFGQEDVDEDEDSVVEPWTDDNGVKIILQQQMIKKDGHEEVALSIEIEYPDDAEAETEGDPKLREYNRDAVMQFPLMRHLELDEYVKAEPSAH